MTSEKACFWVRCVAVVALLVGGISGAFVGIQKAAALSAVQTLPDAPTNSASSSRGIDFGIVAYYAVVGAFVGTVLVSGPLTLFECRRFGKIREDIALASRMKIQGALHDAETYAASKATAPHRIINPLP